jgi:hypothetical protein
MTNVLIYNFFQYYQMDVNNLVFVFNEIFNNSSSDESSDDEVLQLFRGPIVKRPRVRNFEEVVNLYSNEYLKLGFYANCIFVCMAYIDKILDFLDILTNF